MNTRQSLLPESIRDDSLYNALVEAKPEDIETLLRFHDIHWERPGGRAGQELLAGGAFSMTSARTADISSLNDSPSARWPQHHSQRTASRTTSISPYPMLPPPPPPSPPPPQGTRASQKPNQLERRIPWEGASLQPTTCDMLLPQQQLRSEMSRRGTATLCEGAGNSCSSDSARGLLLASETMLGGDAPNGAKRSLYADPAELRPRISPAEGPSKSFSADDEKRELRAAGLGQYESSCRDSTVKVLRAEPVPRRPPPEGDPAIPREADARSEGYGNGDDPFQTSLPPPQRQVTDRTPSVVTSPSFRSVAHDNGDLDASVQYSAPHPPPAPQSPALTRSPEVGEAEADAAVGTSAPNIGNGRVWTPRSRGRSLLPPTPSPMEKEPAAPRSGCRISTDGTPSEVGRDREPSETSETVAFLSEYVGRVRGKGRGGGKGKMHDRVSGGVAPKNLAPSHRSDSIRSTPTSAEVNREPQVQNNHLRTSLDESYSYSYSYSYIEIVSDDVATSDGDAMLSRQSSRSPTRASRGGTQTGAATRLTPTPKACATRAPEPSLVSRGHPRVFRPPQRCRRPLAPQPSPPSSPWVRRPGAVEALTTVSAPLNDLHEVPTAPRVDSPRIPSLTVIAPDAFSSMLRAGREAGYSGSMTTPPSLFPTSSVSSFNQRQPPHPNLITHSPLLVAQHGTEPRGDFEPFSADANEAPMTQWPSVKGSASRSPSPAQLFQVSVVPPKPLPQGSDSRSGSTAARHVREQQGRRSITVPTDPRSASSSTSSTVTTHEPVCGAIPPPPVDSCASVASQIAVTRRVPPRKPQRQTHSQQQLAVQIVPTAEVAVQTDCENSPRRESPVSSAEKVVSEGKGHSCCVPCRSSKSSYVPARRTAPDARGESATGATAPAVVGGESDPPRNVSTRSPKPTRWKRLRALLTFSKSRKTSARA